ncbi:ribonuclease I [Variibacter gotjawalensis]|uniref:Ribonuclease I n=1 Tax=Variibacter gotjawalensis TaxID=1333996 RepID=A0A0S3PTH0_9BRAD|nr:ribonuclease T2 [Variibacter gotjawalensis]NIK49563.1 ribonuclease T2 [Variibacter gotjawalensis]RZS45574.1 ribonuclease T2 [Variibacter gotjawalensis]BAT59247.1 ribonuclease I [Variibacter gotjawalensis]
MSFTRIVSRLAGGLVFLSLFIGSANAQQDRRQNEAGKFNFYVLALSWSPSFCESRGERAPRQQCGSRPYSFVVHGLWPQYERGYPEYCQVPAPRLQREIMTSMLDIMPAPGLIYREWDKHGTCAGTSARTYFENVRKARAIVKIPEQFLDPKEYQTVSPDEVEEAFVKANPGLTREAIAVDCDRRHLREVRVCMTKELGFRNCAEIDRRACRRDKLVMPPVRGGS